VHGTGHGGWCWRFLVSLLRDRGHDVYTPTLTGMGANSHLLHQLDRISLDTHVKDITNMIEIVLHHLLSVRVPSGMFVAAADLLTAAEILPPVAREKN
jgi:pimeloyl-ACP methyl ester carboxylesterase